MDNLRHLRHAPIEIELKSMNGNLSTKITAFTANRVTGNMPAFDWSQCTKQWPHLKHIQFPCIAQRPVVDVLIGADCADLNYAIEEVRRRPRDPIAKLTPLGWTCVGSPGSSRRTTALQTNFAITCFVSGLSEIDRLNENLKRFWEIDDSLIAKNDGCSHTQIIQTEDKAAMKTVESSLRFVNSMYPVGIPWRVEEHTLPNNYNMALRRLSNTEKRLGKSPDIAAAYKEIIGQSIVKGYIWKVPKHEQFKTKFPSFTVRQGNDKEANCV